MKKHIYIATGVVAVVGGLITAVTVSSCDTECTMEAKASAMVSFVDQSGAKIRATELWFTLTDEDTGKVETLRGQCTDESCSEWVLAYERPGTFEVHGTVCEQEYTQKLTVKMDELGCHVETQTARIPVDSSTCPADPKPADEVEKPGICSLEARYSVIANVIAEIDGKMQPVPTDRRYFKWSGDSDQREWPGTCLDEKCTQFAVGLEQEGRFEVAAQVCGQVVSTTVPVSKTDDGCHVDTQVVRLVADIDKCDDKPEAVVYPPTDPACTLEARPSAILMPVVAADDYWMPYPTEQMWFEQGNTRHHAFCADQPDENGKCTRWITGWELDGRFKAFTETCDEVTTVEYSIDKTLDGCHVETQYIPVFMDTHGCIQSPQPKGSSVPDPVYPVGGTDINQGSGTNPSIP